MKQDTEEKLKSLGELSHFDVTGIPGLFNPQGYLKGAHFIYPAVGFKGSCVNLFKVLPWLAEVLSLRRNLTFLNLKKSNYSSGRNYRWIPK